MQDEQTNTTVHIGLCFTQMYQQKYPTLHQRQKVHSTHLVAFTGHGQHKTLLIYYALNDEISGLRQDYKKM